MKEYDTSSLEMVPCYKQTVAYGCRRIFHLKSSKTSGTTTLLAKSFRDGPSAIRYIQSCIRHSCMMRGEGDV